MPAGRAVPVDRRPEIPALRVLLSTYRAGAGDIELGLAAHEEALARAAGAACHLAVFPERSLTGLQPSSGQHQLLTLDSAPVQRLVEATYRQGVSAVFGVGEPGAPGGRSTQLYASQGRLMAWHRAELPGGERDPSDGTGALRFGGLAFDLALGSSGWPEDPGDGSRPGATGLVFLCAGEELDLRRLAAPRASWMALAAAGPVGGAGEPARALLVAPTGEVVATLAEGTHELVVDLPLPVAVEPVREAARVLLLDTEGRTVLVCFADRAGHTWWAAPGGGLEPGEDHLAAARRELSEELGARAVSLGPEIGWRSHTICFDGGHWLTQRERWFLGRCQPFPVPTDRTAFLAAEGVAEVRWWTPAELAASGLVTAPRGLALLAAEALAGRLPDPGTDLGG